MDYEKIITITNIINYCYYTCYYIRAEDRPINNGKLVGKTFDET
jgi:hypothetical protein